MKKFLTTYSMVVVLIAGPFQVVSAQQHLAVDFRIDGADSPSDIASMRAVFEGADPALASAADTDFFIRTGGDGAAWNDLVTPTLLGDFTLTTSGQVVRGAATNNASWTDLEPILETYHWKRDDDADNVSTMIIEGISAAQGDLITLTCWGIGDNTTQDSTFTARYAENNAPGQESFYGDDRATGSNNMPFVQFTFIANGIDNTVEFDWVRHAGRFCAFNAFSISIETPSFGDITSATLMTADETTVIQGAASIQLTAEGTFSNQGLVDVTSLGNSVVTFDASPAGVVSVSEDGRIDPIATGIASVTATIVGDNGTSITTDAIDITVEVPTSFTFSLPDTHFILASGPTEDLNITAESASLTGVNVEGFTGFSYSSDDLNIINVNDASGLLSSLAPGTVNITAELAGFSDSISVTAEEPNALTIEITPAGTTDFFPGGIGTTLSVAVTTPNIATPIIVNGNASLTFSSDGGSDLFVDTAGELTTGTENIGNSIITATYELADLSTISENITLTLLPLPINPLILCHRYSFNAPVGPAPAETVLPDSEGGANGIIVGDGATFDGTSLSIPGGDHNGTGAYIDLPNGIASALPDAITIEAWVTVNGTDNWVRIFDFGSNTAGEDGVSQNQTSHFMLTPQTSGGVVASELTESRALFTNNAVTSGTVITLGQQHHFVITHDSLIGVRNIYLDGNLIASGPSPIGESTLANFDDVNNWLGRSNSQDPRLNGSFDEFRIWKGTMTPEQITTSTAGGPDTLLPGFGTTLELNITDVLINRVEVEATGLGNGLTYYFERLNQQTETFEPILESQFEATADTEILTVNIQNTELAEIIRLAQGVIPN